MRSIAALALLAGCAEGLSSDRDGDYDLGGGYVLNLGSESGGVRCDLFSVRDYPDLAPDDRPGFCVARGHVTGPEPRWLLYRGDNNAVFPPYLDEGVSLTYAGSDNGDATNVKVSGVGGAGALPITLVWGHEDQPDTWAEVLVSLRATRYK